MKTLVLLFLLTSALAVFTSCHKTMSSAAASGISGRWNIIVDSIPEGVGPSAHIDAYQGKDDDYYDFRSDSNVYVKEDGKLSTYSYHINSDTTLTIIVSDEYSDSILQMYHFYQPTSSSLTLATGWFYTPGNIIGRAVYLSR